MSLFLARRAAHAVPLLVGLLTLVFFLSRLLPGDVGTLYLSPTISPAVADQLRTQFGLDRPLLEQYLRWLWSFAHGSLGVSFTYNIPVARLLGEVFPNTAVLSLSALALEILIALGITAAAKRRPGSRFDRWVSRGALVVYALPTFWIGLLLLALFSFRLHLFPSSQMASSGVPAGWGSLLDLAEHLALPSLTLAIPGAAGLVRYLSTSIDEAFRQEHVLAATAMGVPRGKLFRHHVLRNSLGPALSVIGLEVSTLLTGVLVTETLFAWPGMGRLAVASIFARDYPLILGCTLLSGVVVIAANFLVDLLQALIDPRVRLR